MHAACRHAAVQAHLRMPFGCSARTVPQHDPPPQRSGSPPARGGAHSAGGLGLIYTFIDGDRVIEDVGALIDFSFRTQGDQLVMTIDGTDLRSRYAIDDGKLTLRGDDGTERIYLRAGPRSSPPVLHGLWHFRHESGAPAEMFFDRADRGLMRVLMKQREGRYRAADDGSLVMQMNSGSDAALTVSVDGNAMEIRSGGKTRRRRAVIAR